MIITRTPFRISFFGGGTDYPAWYENHGPGAVLSTTIDKYCYLTCRYFPPFFAHRYRISHSGQEFVNTIEEITHPAIRETLRFLEIKEGLSIAHDGDLPARSGLGTSSAFTVGLLHALYGLQGILPEKRKLALEAIKIEQEWTKENVGSQDQTAAAFGGLNKIEFGGPQLITVHPLTVDPERLEELHSCLMLFFTSFARNASEIAWEQIRSIPVKKRELLTMRQMVEAGMAILNSGDNLDRFGQLLHESWQIKRTLSSQISTHLVDNIYQTALTAGARGGKLLGAGGGGFILFFARPEQQPKIREALKNLLEVPFCFDFLGSQIIYSSFHS